LIIGAVAAAAAAFAIAGSIDQSGPPASGSGPSSIATTSASPANAARAAAVSAPAQAGGQGMTVFVDPVTRQPRDPTPEELNALRDQTVQIAEAPQPITTPSGFTGLILGDDQQTYTVAKRRADGTIEVEHAVGGKEAAQKVRDAEVNRGLVVKRDQVAGKERLDER